MSFQKNINKYKLLSSVSSLLFLWLFVNLAFFPQSFLDDVGLEGSETTFILGRRTAMLMLGFSVILFFNRGALHSVARQALALGTGVTMLGLASMGTLELLRGSVGTAILKAIAIEILVAIGFLWVWLAHLRVEVSKEPGAIPRR